MSNSYDLSNNPFLQSCRSDHEKLFEDFAREIGEWAKTGKEPDSVDKSVRYSLDKQEKRLKKKGLRMHLSYETRNMPVMQAQKVLGAAGIQSLQRYSEQMHYRECLDTMEIYRGEKKLYGSKRDSILYESIKEPTGKNWADEDLLYNCPNCSAVSTLRALTNEGCAYCGTHFLASELYPKVINYYFLDTSDHKTVVSRTKKLCLIGGVIGLVIGFFAGKEGLFSHLLKALTGGALGVFGAFVGYNLFRFVKMLADIVRKLPLMGAFHGKNGSRRQMTDQMKKLDPALSYEYVQGRALSLLRMIAFSDEDEDFAQFDGTLPPRFADLIHAEYRGAMAIDDARREGDDIKLELRLYMSDLYEKNGAIEEENEMITLRMSHKATRRIDSGFSIFAVKCPGCGVGFDASQLRHCPYCGADFRPEWEDWIVTDIL